MVWHHVVEQSKVGEFGDQAVNNTANIRGVARGVNQAIADYFSSKQDFTNGLTVREWLKGQSWTDQFEFGLEILKRVLNGEIP